MKKLLYLLLAVVPFIFTACHDDDDLPKVDFNITISNGTYSDGTVYMVQGQTLTVESITVTNLESNKGAMITAASYYWDGYYLGASIQTPYAFEIETTDKTPVGRHTLQIVCPLLAVDKELATAVISYPVEVVATADDMPTGGTTAFTGTPSVSDD